ncbi:PTS sugar transporter subunit IIA [Nocardioides mesophilus]|uniref:PTS sugar transporter subunit IIA n=1 Tax=Nocardioides mesophilus TaxID=433659 RepID=A0A7G9RE42_9ACTN|nr:PTS sugar transporter subunit IIA [Nocardioides mesophilus]QNN53867.1 PTS sugar transporter subunit IIA [Nocardioides mesophilus]
MSGTDATTLVFAEQLSHVGPPAGSREELLQLLAGSALAAGYVHESFTEALLERERSFPTGLPTPLPSAIPHTDTVHVVRPALAAALLSDPVGFAEMGGSGREVAAELVVLLLVDEPGAQVEVLGRLLKVLQKADLRARLAHVTTPAALAETLNAALAQ